jgi:PKD repeat protein
LSNPRSQVWTRHRKARRRFLPRLERLEERTALTLFTLTSPTSLGRLPDGLTPVGGIVLDLVGVNGRRVVSQLPARALFQGFFSGGTPEEYRGNPGTIGIQTSFTPEVVRALGGGLAELAVRVTLFDGDTGPGDFDLGDNFLLLNGLPVGNFSAAVTEETSADGETSLSSNPAGGFRDGRLDTGFFLARDPAFLAEFYARLASTSQVVYQLDDLDPFDNLFDFTQGIDGGLAGGGSPPIVVNVLPRVTSVAGDGPALEGSPVAVTVTAVDPDGGEQPLTYQFDFDGDGVFEQSTTNGTARHVFADEGTFRVRVRVVDVDGGAASAETVVEVFNAPPRLEGLTLPAQVVRGDSATLSALFTDPGSADALTVVVDWGGTGTTTVSLAAGSQSFAAARLLDVPAGTYTVTVTVADEDGGLAEARLTLTVVEPPVPAPAPAPVNLDAQLAIALTAVAPSEVADEGPAALPPVPAAAVPEVAEAAPLLPGPQNPVPLVGGESGSEPEEVAPAAADVVAALAERGSQAAAQVAAAVAQAVRPLADRAAEALDQAFMSLQAEANRIRLAAAEGAALGPAAPPAAAEPAAAPAVASPTATPAPPPPPPARPRGAVLRTTMLALTALVVYRNWSGSRTAPTALIRRLRRGAPPVPTNPAGSDAGADE